MKKLFENIKKLVKKYSRIIRFGIGGLTSASVEFLVFLLMENTFDLYIASLTSFLCGLVTSFLFNKFFVFKSKSKNSKALVEVVKFIVLGLINSQISSWLTVGLSHLIGIEIIAKIITIGFIAVWNYFIMGKLIFRNDKNKNKKEENDSSNK